MSHASDFVVIGAGIAGLLCARELAAHGYATTLIERQKAGREASWAGGGILLPIYAWKQPESIVSLWKESLEIYPGLAHELRESTGIDPEFHACGMLILDSEMHEEAMAWCAEHGVAVERIDANSLKSLLPGIDVLPDWSGLWLPGIAQVRNPRLLAALQVDLRNRGVAVFDDTEVRRFDVKQDRIVAVESDRQRFCAREIVIAAGAWSGSLAGAFAVRPEIVPVKGQMLLYKAQAGLLKSMVIQEDRYLIPRLDGHILAGSTIEHRGFDKSTTEAAKMELDAFAKRIFPAIARAELIDHWAGLRPASPNGIPYIGRHPHISNLSFNCGHYRNGIATGPACARLLVELITGPKSRVSPEAYRINRNEVNV